MAVYDFISVPANNVLTMTDGDDIFHAVPYNFRMNVVVEGKGGNDTISFGRPSTSVLDLNIKTVGNVTTLTGYVDLSTTVMGMPIPLKQYIDFTLNDVETIRFGDELIPTGIKSGSSAIPSTASYLQNKFNLSMDSARSWVMSNINKPQEIFNVCKAGGVTSSMLAEIVQPSFPGVTLTGVAVNDWLASNGLPSL